MFARLPLPSQFDRVIMTGGLVGMLVMGPIFVALIALYMLSRISGAEVIFYLASVVILAGALGAVLTLPEVILGLALLLAFVSLDGWIGWPGRGAGTIAAAHATLSMAYVALVVRARLADFDRSLEEAALDLGATPAEVFLRVTLPLILPALGGGWLIAFMLSLDDVVLASFVAGPGATTLPMAVFSSARLGLNPQINALATIMVGLGALAVLAGVWLLGRQERRR